MSRFRHARTRHAVLLAMFLLVSVAESRAQRPYRTRTTATRTSVDQGFRYLLSKLADKVDIPVRLPNSLASFSTHHARAKALLEKAETYSYKVAVKKWGCKGPYYVCLLGIIEGQANTIVNQESHLFGEKVKLAGRIWGWFRGPGEGRVLSSVHWVQDDVVYSIEVKGSRATAIGIAKSMASSRPINENVVSLRGPQQRLFQHHRKEKQIMSTSSIRRVDFRNFQYRPACFGFRPVQLIGDEAFFVDGGDLDIETEVADFLVFDIAFGDLTGNGTEEAVVLAICNRSSASESEGFVFTMRNGAPTLLARVEGGPRRNGDIQGAVVENGRLRVERVQTAPNREELIEVTTQRLVGTRFVMEGTPQRIRFNGNSTARRVQFERGRTSATFRRETVAGDTFILGARAGQTLLVNVASARDNIFLVIQDVRGAPLIEGQATQFSGRLSETGDYTITVSPTIGVARYTLEITIPPS